MAAPKSSLVTTFTEAERFRRLYTGGRIAVSGDGSYLVCACENDANVMDVATGKTLLTVPAEADEFTAFALHPSLPQLVTAGRSRQLRSWTLDLAAGKSECLRVWKALKMPVLDLAYDPTGTFVASGSSDGTVMVFDVAKGFCTHVFRGHEGVVSLVAFHPTPGRLHLFSCSADTTVRIWDMKTKAARATLRSHVALPTAIAFSDDGETLLTAGRDQLVHVWSLGSHELLNSIATLESMEGIVVLPPAAAEPGAVNPAYRPDAAKKKKVGSAPPAALHFATAGESGLLRYWDARTGRCTRRQAAAPHAAAPPPFSQLTRVGGRRAESGSTGGAVEEEDLLAVTQDHNLLFHSSDSLARTRCIVGNNDEITDLRCIRPDGAASAAATPADAEGGECGKGDGSAAACGQLAVATNSEQIRLFRTRDMACRLLAGHTDVVLSLDVSADHAWLASASKDTTVRVWDPKSGACLAVCEGHVEAVGAVCFARRAPLLLSGGKDKTAKLWDLSALRAKGGARPEGKKAKKAGAAAAAAAPAELLKPHTVSSKLGHSKEINAIAISPNDALAVTGSQDRTLKVWKVEAGGMLEHGTLKGHKRAVWCVAFSPVDKAVASGSGDMTLKIWSMGDFSCLRTFEGHTSSVLKVHFVARGLQLLSSGSDGLIKLWSVKSAECNATLDAHDNKVWALDALETESAGVEVWSGSADSHVVRWRDSTLATQQSAAADEAQLMLDEQELSNAVRAHQFDAALAIALRLKRPRALRQVIEQLLPSEGSDEVLRHAVAGLDAEALAHCLGCARDWNVKATHSLLAHRLINAIIKTCPPATLSGLPQFKATLEALIP